MSNKSMQRGKRGQSNRQNKMTPPQLSTNVMYRHVYRFVSASDTAHSVQGSDLLGVCGTVNTAANIQTLITAAVKLHSVKIWTPPSAQGLSSTCSLEYANATFAPSSEVSDSTMSTAVPAHIASTPPAGSVAAFWITGTGNTIFTIVAPMGSIVDLDMSSVLVDTNAASNAITTTAAGTLGEVYYLGLPSTSPALTPVSLNTIA